MVRSKAPKKFKDRYILATGYPWAVGIKDYTDIRMVKIPRGMLAISLKWPIELWHLELPKYRLVLERVKRGGK